MLAGLLSSQLAIGASSLGYQKTGLAVGEVNLLLSFSLHTFAGLHVCRQLKAYILKTAPVVRDLSLPRSTPRGMRHDLSLECADRLSA